jgi:hypothetical protein
MTVSVSGPDANSSFRNRPALTDGPRLRPRHIRLHSSFLAGLDVLDLEIPAISNDRDLLHIENLFCWLRCLGQQTHIEDLVGDLLLDDQLLLGIHRNLHVVADSNVRVRRHGPAVRVGQRDLILAGALKLHQHFLASCTATSDRGDLLR